MTTSGRLHTHSVSDGGSAAKLAYQRALRCVRPGPLCILLVLTGLLGGFLVPGIALCGWLRGWQIAWAIVATTIGTGLAYLAHAHRLEARDVVNPRVEQFLLSGVLLIAAGAMYATLVAKPGPMAGKSFDPWTLLAIALPTAAVGIVVMRRRARRLVAAAARPPT